MQTSQAVEKVAAPSGNQFGTFGGVFTPSILTILGVIMYLRAGYVTGVAGIRDAIIILVVAKMITFLTGLSISGISTNTKVEGGGAYFLISRSLGPGYGGAIGLALFLAQALSVPFYILGFTEAIVASVPALQDYFLWIGVGTTVLLFVINYIGADIAIKAQYFILAVLVLSVISFTIGSGIDFEMSIFKDNWANAYEANGSSFWIVFAIFFPAVTGIMAGVNMSGDLKDPSKSIPKGTLAAIAVGFLVYLMQILITGGAIVRETLIAEPYESLLAQSLLGFGVIVAAGVFAATLSSALGSFLGAPRILQALARDDIFPVLRPFGKGHGENDEPRRGYILTFIMTILVLVVASKAGGGALNIVAAVLTMFFLYTYGMMNMAAFIEKVSLNPSFRPRFRYFHWVTALLGAVGCIGAAFLINPIAAIAAAVMIGAVFIYTERRALETTFGDSRRGFYYSIVRANLLRLATQAVHPKNWRPTTLVLSGNPASRHTLCSYAVWMESGRGIVTLTQVIVGDLQELHGKRVEARAELDRYIEENNLQAFSDVVVSGNFDHGVEMLLQCQSIGPLKPNVVMMGWAGDPARANSFAKLLNLAQDLRMSQVVVLDRGLPEERHGRRIDLWWRGQDNGSLMMILAYLLTLNWEWKSATIRVLRLVRDDDDREASRKEIVDLADAARVDAEIKLVTAASVREALITNSADASVVLLGFRPPSMDRADAFHAQYTELVEGLPTTLLIHSTGEANLFA